MVDHALIMGDYYTVNELKPGQGSRFKMVGCVTRVGDALLVVKNGWLIVVGNG